LVSGFSVPVDMYRVRVSVTITLTTSTTLGDKNWRGVVEW